MVSIMSDLNARIQNESEESAITMPNSTYDRSWTPKQILERQINAVVTINAINTGQL